MQGQAFVDAAQRVTSALVEVLRSEARRAAERPGPDGEALAAALDAFSLELSGARRGAEFNAATLEPVRGLRYFPAALGLMTEAAPKPLADAARDASGWAAWSEYYEEDDWSAPFLDQFAVGELVGPSGPWRCDHLVAGLFLFGPELDYPPHAHAAEEIYLVLGGEAEFQVGADQPFETKRPGDVIFHGAHVSHAIRTAGSPVFGLYAWRGDIHEPAWRRASMLDESEPVVRLSRRGVQRPPQPTFQLEPADDVFAATAIEPLIEPLAALSSDALADAGEAGTPTPMVVALEEAVALVGPTTETGPLDAICEVSSPEEPMATVTLKEEADADAPLLPEAAALAALNDDASPGELHAPSH